MTNRCWRNALLRTVSLWVQCRRTQFATKLRLFWNVTVLILINKKFFEVFKFGPTDVDTVTVTYKSWQTSTNRSLHPILNKHNSHYNTFFPCLTFYTDSYFYAQENILTFILKFRRVVRIDATDEANDTQETNGDAEASRKLQTLAPHRI